VTESAQIAHALKQALPQLSPATCQSAAKMFIEAAQKATADGCIAIKAVRVFADKPRPPLGVLLQQYRRQAGFYQSTAAKAIEWSTEKLVRIEGGRVGISITDLRALLNLYHITDQSLVTQLEDLARKSRLRKK
jgi:DNA-binding XRE family transcriptional regulator